MKVKVMLWGKQIGTLFRDSENPAFYVFKYEEDFVESQIQVCPILMPLRKEPYKFENLSIDTFGGLVPLLVDSLPDKYGNSLLSAWAEDNNISSIAQDEILLFIGKRGMGALEFEPSEKEERAQHIEIDLLLDAAKQILNYRKGYRDNINNNQYLMNLIDVGSSIGGARAKAVVAINDEGDIRSGQIAGLKGYKYYILKFDGVNSNLNEAEVNVPPYTKLEYVYYRIAKDCGINMQECKLLKVNGKSHFITQRFDRDEQGNKIHMLSLAGMLGMDYKMAGRYSYEEVAMLLNRLQCDYSDVVQLYRRMIFNIIGKNHDDHIKNISFLMDKEGMWRLAPAYDLTYSYNPNGLWTKYHQMRINNRIDDITLNDVLESAKQFGISQQDAKNIITEESFAFSNFEAYSNEESISKDIIEKIKNNLVQLK